MTVQVAGVKARRGLETPSVKENAMQMVIGTRKWSTWSMRPWLVARRAGLPVEDIVVALRRPETAMALEPYSPSCQCPVLIDGKLTVWDSLAICEYLAD